MIVLNIAVFDPMKLQAVCGTVPSSNCSQFGPDLNCLAKVSEFVPIESVSNPGISVGIIDQFGGNEGTGVSA